MLNLKTKNKRFLNWSYYYDNLVPGGADTKPDTSMFTCDDHLYCSLLLPMELMVAVRY